MRFANIIVAATLASAKAIPTKVRTVDDLANELACVARGDMACAGLVSKRTADDLANELACVARGDMACAGLVGKREDSLANELACVARGDMACAGLVGKRTADELANELACVARGDMACAGVRTCFGLPVILSMYPVMANLPMCDSYSWSSVASATSAPSTRLLAAPMSLPVLLAVTWPAPALLRSVLREWMPTSSPASPVAIWLAPVYVPIEPPRLSPSPVADKICDPYSLLRVTS